MLGHDRCLKSLRGEKVDRISVHPEIDLVYAAPQFNVSVGECFIYPETHAKALVNSLELHPDVDGLYVNLCVSPKIAVEDRTELDGLTKEEIRYIKDSAGMTWRIPNNDVGAVTEHDIVDLDDERLITEDPFIVGILETYKLIPEETKKKYLIIPGITSPYCQLDFILGMTPLLLAMYDEPEKLKKALQHRTNLAIKWANEYAKLGVECVWIGDGSASSSIISPEMYEEFVLPYVTQLVDVLKSHGITSIMHVCGDINPSIDVISRSGVDGLDIDFPVDLEVARKKVPKHICFKGNLNPVNLLQKSADEIYKECQEIILNAGEPFVLSTGCLLARDTPPKNVDAMVKAAMEYKK
ncbi:methylcobamide--CoM methyltransferase [Clostridium sediminicola]|uniref:uroporphyrinogen decarboxylase family protein n=1 Tax=Clostridium sediminicola TaxID=3114879 RepID=UPI0031F25A16